MREIFIMLIVFGFFLIPREGEWILGPFFQLLRLAGFELLDAFLGRRQILWHGSAQLLDGLPHFLADFKMHLVCSLLAFNPFPADLCLRLGDPEPVGGKFFGPHMIQDLLAWFQTLAFVDLSPADPSV